MTKKVLEKCVKAMVETLKISKLEALDCIIKDTLVYKHALFRFTKVKIFIDLRNKYKKELS